MDKLTENLFVNDQLTVTHQRAAPYGGEVWCLRYDCVVGVCAGYGQAADGGGPVELSARVPAREPVRQRPAGGVESAAQHAA